MVESWLRGLADTVLLSVPQRLKFAGTDENIIKVCCHQQAGLGANFTPDFELDTGVYPYIEADFAAVSSCYTKAARKCLMGDRMPRLYRTRA